MDNKEKLKKIIDDSSILEDEKELWAKFIDISSAKETDPILEYLEENPKGVDFFTENLKSKLDSFKEKDVYTKCSGFNKTLGEEKKYLKKIAE
jgi:hypothetical protein